MDENLNLVLVDIGAASSKTATDFRNDVMSPDAGTFNVVSADNSRGVTLGQAALGGDTVKVDFADFQGMKTGRVNPASLNTGAVVIHELCIHTFAWPIRGRRKEKPQQGQCSISRI